MNPGAVGQVGMFSVSGTAQIGRTGAWLSALGFQRILWEKNFHAKFSGNEIYRTNALLLPIKTMMYSELHCRNV